MQVGVVIEERETELELQKKLWPQIALMHTDSATADDTLPEIEEHHKAETGDVVTQFLVDVFICAHQ